MEIALATKSTGMRYVRTISGDAMPSTAIRDIFYNSVKRELRVTFVTGRRYVYAGVPPDVFDAFKTASSRGAFFNGEIRDRYETREVTPASGAERNRWVGGGE